MNGIFAMVLQAAGMLVSAAAAQMPSAVVEEVSGGVAGVQFMDYVEAGQVTIGFVSLAAALPQLRTGKLRAMAVTSVQRAPAAPSVPTTRSPSTAWTCPTRRPSRSALPSAGPTG